MFDSYSCVLCVKISYYLFPTMSADVTNKRHIRHSLRYELNRKSNATKAATNIGQVYGGN